MKCGLLPNREKTLVVVPSDARYGKGEWSGTTHQEVLELTKGQCDSAFFKLPDPLVAAEPGNQDTVTGKSFK